MAKRINLGKLHDILEIPNLINIQVKSYEDFLQKEIAQKDRKCQGLEEVLREIFPIESYDKKCVIDYTSYTIGTPKIGLLDCLKDGESFSSPLNIDFKLDNNGEIKTESVYMGEIPIMTDKGTFVINGAERVIISQLHRSPGICFEKKTTYKRTYSLLL